MSEVIDFHTHNFPDVLAPRAIESMARKLRGSLVPFGDGTVATQLRDMAAAGVDKAVVCPVATKPAQFQTILDRAKAVRDGEFGEEAANRLVQLCSVHPADPDFEGHIGQVAAAGFKGVKVHPYYQGFSLGDPKVVPYFRAVRDAGLFVIAHCGIDLGFVEAPMVCGPSQIASLLKAVPGLKFVAAHIGGCGGNPRELLPPHCGCERMRRRCGVPSRDVGVACRTPAVRHRLLLAGREVRCRLGQAMPSRSGGAGTGFFGECASPAWPVIGRWRWVNGGVTLWIDLIRSR